MSYFLSVATKIRPKERTKRVPYIHKDLGFRILFIQHFCPFDLLDSITRMFFISIVSSVINKSPSVTKFNFLFSSFTEYISGCNPSLKDL